MYDRCKVLFNRLSIINLYPILHLQIVKELYTCRIFSKTIIFLNTSLCLCIDFLMSKTRNLEMTKIIYTKLFTYKNTLKCLLNE